MVPLAAVGALDQSTMAQAPETVASGPRRVHVSRAEAGAPLPVPMLDPATTTLSAALGMLSTTEPETVVTRVGWRLGTRTSSPAVPAGTVVVPGKVEPVSVSAHE